MLVLNCTMKHNWFADITGRVGVVAVERSLIYLKGGVAWEGSNFSVGNSVNVGGTTLAANASGSGVTCQVWVLSMRFCRTGRRRSNLTTSTSARARKSSSSSKAKRARSTTVVFVPLPAKASPIVVLGAAGGFLDRTITDADDKTAVPSLPTSTYGRIGNGLSFFSIVI